MDLIDLANDVCDVAENYSRDSLTHKELKKIEMYCRKTFLMIRHFQKLKEHDHTEETFMKDLNAALIRDQKYVKARDNLESYEI